jgi:hypothetical protein
MSAKTFFLSIILLIFSTLSNDLMARTPQTPPSVFDYLTTEEGVHLNLELDLTELINNKKTNQYFPGTLTTASGQMFGIEVRPRGKYRRRTCDVPPLKMKFRKKELKALGLDTLNEIKIAVPCFDDPESETLLLREYVAYRMFERLNPDCSVRARLVHITFHDKHIEKTRAPVYGLLIEHEEQVAARLDGDLVEYYNLPPDSINAEQAALNALFQFMIGNTDWAISEVRNVYCLKPHKGGKICVIPFDFDFSGLVNAPYAIPSSHTGLKNVRERLLLADGIPDASLQQALQVFRETQSALVGLCQGAFLSEKSSGYMKEYIEKFFAAVGNCTTIPPRIKGNLR